MKNCVLLILLTYGSLSYSQIELLPEVKERKHSLGLDYRFETFSEPNIGITYRHFYKTPYNLRANFNFGGSNFNQVGSLFNGDLLVYQTNDTATPFLGVPSIPKTSSAYQRLELGLEREFSVWKINFIGGIDGIVGHRIGRYSHEVFEVEEGEVERNGITYSQYQIKPTDTASFFNYLNSVSATRNFLSIGVNLRLGVKINLSERLFATGFMSYRIEQRYLVNENIRYENESYKEHIPIQQSQSFGTSQWFTSVGLNYKF